MFELFAKTERGRLIMRKREEILKNFIDFGWVRNVMSKDKKGNLENPKLQLEVLLDIRDLLLELTKKS